MNRYLTYFIILRIISVPKLVIQIFYVSNWNLPVVKLLDVAIQLQFCLT